MENFCRYLDLRTVISDYHPIRWLIPLKTLSSRLARWALVLQMYILQIDYVPGRNNMTADTLSRPPGESNVCTVTIDLPTTAAEDMRCQQIEDPDIKKIIDTFRCSRMQWMFRDKPSATTRWWRSRLIPNRLQIWKRKWYPRYSGLQPCTNC